MWGPIFIVVIGQLVYHSVMRRVSSTGEPSELIAASYLVALTSVLAWGVIAGRFSLTSAVSLRNLAPAIFVGLAVAAVELGYLYAYRCGLPLNTGALRVFAITAIGLACIGGVFFGERLNPKVIFGCGLAIFGVWLMSSGAAKH